MRTRVYRNYTFRAYTEANEAIVRSDNFFTVESQITEMLKQRIANGEPSHTYTIRQESKDGRWSREIETVLFRADEIYIDMATDFSAIVPEALESVARVEEVCEQELEKKETKKSKKAAK